MKSLEVFVTAGTLLSFGQAADELGLSASAVSRRIRALEEDLETALFIRRSKSVELTDAGAAYLAELAPAFVQIRQATSDIRQLSRRLVITAPQSFAVSWLTPRLPAFRARHPEINIDLEVSADITGRHADGYDVGIFLSKGDWPERHAERLIPISVFPVTSPEIGSQVSEPADLLAHPLIHVRQLANAWDEWFSAVGLADVLNPAERPQDMVFNDVQLAYEAAQQGLGMAVGADAVVGDYLQRGALVAPLKEQVKSGFSYYVVCARSRYNDPEVRQLLKWLREAAATL